MMEAVLSNSDHPEFGEVTIPLPIPREQYDHCIELVNALEIGSVVAPDCHVSEICKGWPVFYRLEGMQVNLDELDYLAKRLESFDVGEYAQFQAMAEKLDLTSMKDLINLTFCCQQATVITDFSDLAAIGRSHYLNTHGGCASTEELEHLDGEETAILLIEGSEGTVTRYGVVYDNGMQLSQLYDGKHLPGYHYEADMIMVGLVSRQEPENTKNVTWIYLPASKGQIERAIQRSGIVDPKDMCFRMGDSMFPEEVDVALDFRCEDIYELNDLAQAVGKLSHNDSIFLDRLHGKEITYETEPQYLTGSRTLRAEDISFAEDIIQNDNLLEFYMEVPDRRRQTRKPVRTVYTGQTVPPGPGCGAGSGAGQRVAHPLRCPRQPVRPILPRPLRPVP